jgi:replication factor C subunit 2/4
MEIGQIQQINKITEKKEKENKEKLFIYKFQPIYFNDFEIDPQIIEIFNTLIAMDNLNVLLIGNMASGKTSLLNAIINEYYKGYTFKQYEENILYINSLKEQGINYYRSDVKTFCQNCSSIKNKKKIVVLDDIDLINEQSQQVFRNCIDKYSHNVHFISSCNNIQKVIESLQSRFVIIKIQSLKKENMTKILNKIKTSENIDIDPIAEDFILNISNNTVKILLNYMEKFKILNEKITHDLVIQLCTNISFLTFEEYTNLLKNNKLHEAIKIINEIYDKGYSVMDILDSYFIFIKNTTILTEEQKYNIIPIICKYITIFHNIHEDEIELALFTNNLNNVFL